MNIYESLTKWLTNNYSDINDWLYFNAEKHEDGNTSVMSSESNASVETFIDGSKLITLPFVVSMIKEYDFEQSETNLNSMSEAQNFIDWMQAQELISNYPQLGDNCIVEEIAVSDTVPTVWVNQADNLAKYQVNCTIKYLEQKG